MAARTPVRRPRTFVRTINASEHAHTVKNGSERLVAAYSALTSSSKGKRTASSSYSAAPTIKKARLSHGAIETDSDGSEHDELDKGASSERVLHVLELPLLHADDDIDLYSEETVELPVRLEIHSPSSSAPKQPVKGKGRPRAATVSTSTVYGLAVYEISPSSSSSRSSELDVEDDDAELCLIDPLDPSNADADYERSRGSQARRRAGEGGLLDALLQLRNAGLVTLHDETLVLRPEGLSLKVEVELLDGFFMRNGEDPSSSAALRIAIAAFFPSVDVELEQEDGLWPEGGNAGLDYFYRKMEQRTALRATSGAPTAPAAPAAEMTEEEVRRAQKGKGRAKSPTPALPAAEQETLKPQGLKSSLHAFQSRSVRWLIAREGKEVQAAPASPSPSPKKKGSDAVLESRKGGSASGSSPNFLSSPMRGFKRVRMNEVVVPSAPARTSSSSSLARRETMELDDSDSQQQEEESRQATSGPSTVRTTPSLDDDDKDDVAVEDEGGDYILTPLPREILDESARGPLWIPRVLRVRDLETGDKEERTVWVNKVLGAVSREDPAVRVSVKEDEPEYELLESDEEPDKTIEEVLGGEVEGCALLAEEMGLGKSVEVISLILMHRAPERNKLPVYYSPDLDSDVQPTGLTLIVSPSTIVDQWRTEFSKHAPGVRVFRYEGIKKVPQDWTARKVAKEFDVLLTTFDTLRQEVVLARKPHERNMRSAPEKRHRYRRSLLVQINFLRVVMDEVQMVASANSTASETTSLVPRRFSLAVSGTPLKSSVRDLEGLLKFLKIDPFTDASYSKAVALQRLLSDRESFDRLCVIGTRTLKSDVEHELAIPKQERVVVPVEFSAPERYWYDQKYKAALEALGLNADGTPGESAYDEDGNLSEDWALSKVLLNKYLMSLRQLACHPQLGIENNKALGGGNALKSLDEVLVQMRNNAISTVQTDARTLLASRAKRAQLLLFDKENCEHFEQSQKLCDQVLKDLAPYLEELVQQYQTAYAEIRVLRTERFNAAKKAKSKQAKLARIRNGEDVMEEDTEDELEEAPAMSRGASGGSSTGGSKGKGKAKADDGFVSMNPAYQAIADVLQLAALEEEKVGVDETDAAVTPKERALSARLSGIKGRLHDFLLIQHQAHMFRAQAFFGMARFPSMEDDAYDDAESTRQMMLRPYELRVKKTVDGMHAILKSNKKIEKNGMDVPKRPKADRPGIETSNIFDDVDETSEVLNGYSKLIGEWREVILQAIDSRVSIAGNGGTGEEYLETGEIQEKGDIHLEVYSLVLSDWRYALTGERTALGASNAVNAAQSAARAAEASLAATESSRSKAKSKRKAYVPSIHNGASPAEILYYKLNKDREAVRGKDADNALMPMVPLNRLSEQLNRVIQDRKSVISEIELAGLEENRAQANEIKNARIEIEIASQERARVKEIVTSRTKVLDRMAADLKLLTKTFNSRVQYFTQLQTISDSVNDPDQNSSKWLGLLNEMSVRLGQEAKLQNQIDVKGGNRRYLDSLIAHSSDELERICIICSEEYERGVLTTCGHMACQTCWTAWTARSKLCPLCKRNLGGAGSWQKVTFGEVKENGPKEGADGEGDAGGMNLFKEAGIKLNVMPQSYLDELATVESALPLSSKSDLIVRHVTKIRRDDPGAKIVIFSAWTEALRLLQSAFTRNGIQFRKLEGTGKKGKVVKEFLTDPDVAAFFLHTKSQSAGLTLVEASYAILVEPLLHPSHELQAVGRIHRIGQKKPTTVWQYSVLDTVDARVAELRARNRSSLFLAEAPTDGERKLAADIAAASGDMSKSEEAIDDVDDVLNCLLDPVHYNNLQAKLLPAQLRGDGQSMEQGRVDRLLAAQGGGGMEIDAEPMVVGAGVGSSSSA